jgi:hypothetical protein
VNATLGVSDGDRLGRLGLATVALAIDVGDHGLNFFQATVLSNLARNEDNVALGAPA